MGVFDRLARDLVRRGVRDGLVGGSAMWVAVGALAWAARFLWRRPSVSVVTETLRTGETITVKAVPAPPFGRRARKLAKQDRAEARVTARQVRDERKRAQVPETGGGAPPPS